MKKSFAISLALSVCLSVIALAADNDKNKMDSKTLQGTITRVDTAGKFLVVRDSSDKETTVYWDESTHVVGDLKEGASVQLNASEREGKTFATSITARAPAKPY